MVLYFAGRVERTHPDEYSIEFDSLVSQPDEVTCGPTSAAMILQHYGKGVSVEEVAGHAKTHWFRYRNKPIGMTSPDYLCVAMQRYLSVELKYGNVDVLKHYVAQGRPCIVNVRSGSDSWHYIVVYGFTQEKIKFADPGGGVLREMDIITFDRCWGWTHDMNGTECSRTLCTLLRCAEVYPYSFIVPDSP